MKYYAQQNDCVSAYLYRQEENYKLYSTTKKYIFVKIFLILLIYTEIYMGLLNTMHKFMFTQSCFSKFPHDSATASVV